MCMCVQVCHLLGRFGTSSAHRRHITEIRKTLLGGQAVAHCDGAGTFPFVAAAGLWGVLPMVTPHGQSRPGRKRIDSSSEATVRFGLSKVCPATDGVSAARIEEEVIVTPAGAQIITLFPADELPIANRY